jgi:hypothetical protein
MQQPVQHLQTKNWKNGEKFPKELNKNSPGFIWGKHGNKKAWRIHARSNENESCMRRNKLALI